MHRRAAFVAHVAALLSIALVPATAAAAPTVTSGNGISVLTTADVSPRTFDVRVSTPAVSDRATFGGNAVRITLPRDYATSGKRYPVLYLLHGGSDGSYDDWYRSGGVEATSAASDVILVMPDGGKAGWYTNWVDQRSIAQDWETYHLDQLVPFVDRNLRTIATRDGRAIAGLSMGGFGAVHYAQERPDLFGAVASFSGAVDLDSPLTRATIVEQSAQHGLPALGAFGSTLFAPANWNAANPMRHAARLRDTEVLLYHGSGPHPVEIVMAGSNMRFDRALTAAGVPHLYRNYGIPLAATGGACYGGHQWSCWSYALQDALPRLTAAMDPAT